MEIFASSSETTQLSPLFGDPWIMSSLLQKAIRRADTALALRAAATLVQSRGRRIWRRLAIIAVEDIGIGDMPVISEVLSLARCGKGQSREHAFRLVAEAVEILSSATKDRSADYLICAAKGLHRWEQVRAGITRLSVPERIALSVGDGPIGERAVSCWFASGVEWEGEHRFDASNLPGLLSAFRGRGVPDAIVAATEETIRLTRHPIAVMLPLLWHENTRSGNRVHRDDLPPSAHADGLPLYALDFHTRLGRYAIGRFSRECRVLADHLAQHAPEFRHRTIVNIAAFYAEAAVTRDRLVWSRAREFEDLGLETDFSEAGFSAGLGRELVELVRNHLDHLNRIRCEEIAKYLAAGGARS